MSHYFTLKSSLEAGSEIGLIILIEYNMQVFKHNMVMRDGAAISNCDPNIKVIKFSSKHDLSKFMMTSIDDDLVGLFENRRF